jgi:hypothetical protein
MDISVKIETIKSQMIIHFSSTEIQNQFNTLLNVIRDLEFESEKDNVKATISVLDDILNLLGTMMLATGEEENS